MRFFFLEHSLLVCSHLSRKKAAPMVGNFMDLFVCENMALCCFSLKSYNFTLLFLHTVLRTAAVAHSPYLLHPSIWIPHPHPSRRFRRGRLIPDDRWFWLMCSWCACLFFSLRQLHPSIFVAYLSLFAFALGIACTVCVYRITERQTMVCKSQRGKIKKNLGEFILVYF